MPYLISIALNFQGVIDGKKEPIRFDQILSTKRDSVLGTAFSVVQNDLGLPGVYTRVASYYNLIKAHVIVQLYLNKAFLFKGTSTIQKVRNEAIFYLPGN